MMIGQIMAELRTDNGLNQDVIAELLNVTTGTISNYETGMHNPSLESVLKLADFYHVSTDYLFGRTTRKNDVLILDKPITKSMTIGDLIYLVTQFSGENKRSLVEYVGLLKMRDS